MLYSIRYYAPKHFENKLQNIQKLSKYKYFNTSVTFKENFIIVKEQKGKCSLKSYIKNNVLDVILLFTILNECCTFLMLYHNLLDCYHGNTNVNNFVIYDDNRCIIPLSNISYDCNKLDKQTKFQDYYVFFSSFFELIKEYNQHLIVVFIIFYKKYMKKMNM